MDIRDENRQIRVDGLRDTEILLKIVKLAKKALGTSSSAPGPIRETSGEGQNLLLIIQPRETENCRG